MAKVLSQDEIDSLLDGISDGRVETETDIPEKIDDVEVYDFRLQTGPIHQRMPGLGIIYERLVGFLRTSLSMATHAGIDVNLASTESVKFSEFCRSLPLPASLNVFKIDPLRGFSMIVLEGPMVFSFVDSFFGGKGVSHVKLEGRGFTTIETKIIEKVVKIVLNDLQKAWSDIYPINPVFMRSEMDLQFATIVSPDDVVIVSKLMVDLENTSGSITVCIPHSTIEPIRDKLKSRFQGEKLELDKTWRSYIEKKIRKVAVNIDCTLGTAKISSRELLEMKINDVIPLDQKVSDSIVVSIEGIPKYKGYPGACSNKKAVKIDEKIIKE
ncbi:MAG: flagellar motor switch protein FliM [Deltaproteobacteria bacterium]|nr:flagellar motor switch protein FliM [Deltaproteobacteria bacterium]